MTITLEPKLEALVQKRLESGALEDVQDVLFQALESQDAEESWLALHQREVSEKIDRGLAQLDRGESMTPEQSLAWLEEQKSAWRANRNR